jgi:CheY-like chemotaxis protein
MADQLHALILEDEMIVALEIQALLGDLGYASCDFADDAAAAVRSACTRRPDLVTVDLRIVGGSGLEAIGHMIAAVGPVPYLFVTANADFVRGLTEAPVVDKPISASRFRAACLTAVADPARRPLAEQSSAA